MIANGKLTVCAHHIRTTAVVTGLLVKRPLSPGSDCSESESSLAIRIKCTPPEANDGLGQWTDPRILAEVPRRRVRRLMPAE